jgi:hypothetical protein|tara:strand:- start:454 stop:600 length:147 start_codon:yes stop_codon:yes gene_type:complete
MEKFLPSMVELIFDWLRFEDYLGNVNRDIVAGYFSGAGAFSDRVAKFT